MAFPQQLSLSSSSTLFSPHFKPSIPFFKLPFKTPNHLTFNSLPSSSSSFSSSEEQAMLEAVAQSQGNSLPCVRTYENDMARLSLTGSVAFEQALTAAASDGGEAAGEHVDAGLSAMVVEALYPGPNDEHSTVSTRLFLPAKKVKEKARKLRSSLPEDMLSGTNSSNILAMTFRQVVVQELWNFELAVFRPGSQRNMEDLGSPREVTASFVLSSSDDKVIAGLAEAVCMLALESTQKEFFQESAGRASDGLFNWFSKTKQFSSKDSSVMIHRFEDKIVEKAKSLFDKFNVVRAKYKMTNKKPTSSAWTSLMQSKLEKIGGSEFSMWTMEYVPAYKLQIDADRLTNLKFEGWKRTMGNCWEVFLTHSQMGGFSLVGFLRTTLITATLLVSVGVLIKLFVPHLNITRRKYPRENYVLPSSEDNCEQVQPLKLEDSELDAYCSSIVKKIKDSYGWNGEVTFEPSVGAWIGEFPMYLRYNHQVYPIDQDSTSSSEVSATNKEDLETSVQEIASYQIVLSPEGRIVGFQPTSLVAVNHWSNNPIAKELYGGKELSPGLLEPRLKIHKPEKVIVLELLMSLNQDNHFALVRQMQ
ncbi:uncharacterized protein LOC110693694 isoform X2 [Chenopodium quinoa]|uniref:uncharacterized protein LOC110693694 isoform X2 n=1 Tax=Chenopodium quinoa TaxID=63459 RepID=UPI000B77596A|nr:uncharacterized protein LOC110693694 isoform X2 [Chenopodium quinoa]